MSPKHPSQKSNAPLEPGNPDIISTDEQWPAGKELLKEYVVDKILGQGGMGTVYLVTSKHNSAVQFAVKTLKSSYLPNKDKQRAFLRELRTWIDLPEHPNLTACRFFRTIEDQIVIFSEYVAGGTLTDWILQKKLVTLDKILDVAIQFAWGLHTAHEYGVVHQDVKSSNVLLSLEGIPKITDFGLSRVPRRNQDSTSRMNVHKESVMYTSSGMTLAYCSPEQAMGLKVTRKTDIWSWGLSILEMFAGDLFWKVGSLAQNALNEYISNDYPPQFPPMPDPVIEVIKKCFCLNPADRWTDILEPAQALQDIYREVIGDPYPRRYTEVLNPYRKHTMERITLLGGNWHDPMPFLKSACESTSKDLSDFPDIDPSPRASRKSQALADLEVFNLAYRLFETKNDTQSKEKMSLISYQKGIILNNMGDASGALNAIDKSIQLTENLIREHGQNQMKLNLSDYFREKASILNNNLEFEDALKLCDKAAEFMNKSTVSRDSTDFSHKYASLYASRSAIYWKLGKIEEACNESKHALELWERLFSEEERIEFAEELSRLYPNRAIFLWQQDQFEEALDLMDKAVNITEFLVYQQGRNNMTLMLANAYMNKANAFCEINKLKEAINLFDRSIILLEHLYYDEGKHNILNDLGIVYLNKAGTLMNMDRLEESLIFVEKSISIREYGLNVAGMQKIRGDLAWSKLSKAYLLRKMNHPENVPSIAKDAYRIILNEIERTNDAELKNLKDWAENTFPDEIQS